MLGRALDAGVPAAWVTADEAYGKDYKFRSWLEQRRIGYVVAVACNQVVPGHTGTSRADVLASHAPQDAQKRRSCGEGAKGPRLFDWAVASLPCYEDTTPPGWSRWLLVRRSLTRNSKGEHELAYYLCCAPAGTADDELIRVAGTRWAVEECFQTAKNETGLDHYQVRRYDAWYRHITLAMLAHAYLAVTAAIAPEKHWQRPHQLHARRGPPSPGTPDHHRPHQGRRLGLVPLAPPPPAPRQNQPLPAKTRKESRSAAGVLRVSVCLARPLIGGLLKNAQQGARRSRRKPRRLFREFDEDADPPLLGGRGGPWQRQALSQRQGNSFHQAAR